MKQVGLAGEGRLAVGTPVNPTPSLASVGDTCFQDSVSLHPPVQPQVLPTLPQRGSSGVGKRPAREEGGPPPTKVTRLESKDLQGRVKRSRGGTRSIMPTYPVFRKQEERLPHLSLLALPPWMLISQLSFNILPLLGGYLRFASLLTSHPSFS